MECLVSASLVLLVYGMMYIPIMAVTDMQRPPPYTVWREIFAGQNVCGFRGFASDRENFNREIFEIVVLCALCFVIVEARKILLEIFASGQSAKILSRENFSPYGISLVWGLLRFSLFVHVVFWSHSWSLAFS